MEGSIVKRETTEQGHGSEPTATPSPTTTPPTWSADAWWQWANKATAPQLRSLLTSQYNVGQFFRECGAKHLDLRNVKFPEKVRIGLFGFPSSGKSSSINTILRAVQDNEELIFFARPGYTGDDNGGVTLVNESFAIGPKVVIYDTRGIPEFSDPHKSAFLATVEGATSTHTPRLAHGWLPINYFDAPRLNLAAITVPADLHEESRIAIIKDLVNLLSERAVPYVILVTKPDIVGAKETDGLVEKLAEMLSINTGYFAVIQNYTHKTQPRSIEIETTALKAVAFMIQEAELGFKNKRQSPPKVETLKAFAAHCKTNTIYGAGAVLLVACFVFQFLLFASVLRGSV